MKIDDLNNDRDDFFKKYLNSSDLRNTYKEFLKEKENNQDEVDPEDIHFLHNQFCNFVTMQLLHVIATNMFEDDSNGFLNDLIKSFVNQLRTNFFRGFELSELKQQGSVLSKLIGQDMLDKGNDYGKKKMNKMIDVFEEQIRQILHVDKNTKPPREDIV